MMEGLRIIQGHRGFSSRYPENTMLAFREAIRAGANGIELDVRATADGELVIMHDSTVDRTTNGTGSVSSLRWDYLKDLDAGAWRGPEFADREDTRIPRLADVLDEFAGQSVQLLLHISTPINYIETIINMVLDRNMLSQVVCFGGLSLVHRFRILQPRAFAHSAEQPATVMAVNEHVAIAKEYGFDAVSIHPSVVTPELVADIHSRGLYVHCYLAGAETETTMHTMLDAGVNYILGDNVEMMVNVAASRGVYQVAPSPIVGWRTEYNWRETEYNWREKE